MRMSIAEVVTVSPEDVSAGTSLDFSHLNDDDLRNEIRGLASLAAASMCRLLLLVAELDKREAWGAWGIKSCAHWLSWQCGFSMGAAREHVRVARSLVELPLVVDMFSRGEITYAKVRAITRAANSKNEELLVSYAKLATAAQLESIVRGYRKANELKMANEAQRKRSLSWSYRREGVHTLTIHVTAEEKAVIEKALAKERKNVPAETSETHAQVDAFVQIAKNSLVADQPKPSPTHTVNVNVSLETLSENADGECEIDGESIAPETARRLSCDSPIVMSLINEDGVTLKMGRKSRLFTGASRAAVLKRDKGTCAFPGCDHKRWIDVHHITHWSQGGPTDPDNGIVLCGFHHRLIQEGGFSVDHSFTFRTPDGQVIPKAGQLTFDPIVASHVPTVNQQACVSTQNGEPMCLNDAVSVLMEAS